MTWMFKAHKIPRVRLIIPESKKKEEETHVGSTLKTTL